MPLNDLIAEVMDILKSQPNAPELCVKNVLPLRFAAEAGREKYEQQFRGFNDAVTAAANAGH